MLAILNDAVHRRAAFGAGLVGTDLAGACGLDREAELLLERAGEHGVIHYCVPNMPGAYPRTSTMALTEATLSYAIGLADHGLDALREDGHFARGVNTHHGHVCYRPVAEDLELMDRYEDFSKLAG